MTCTAESRCSATLCSQMGRYRFWVSPSPVEAQAQSTHCTLCLLATNKLCASTWPLTASVTSLAALVLLATPKARQLGKVPANPLCALWPQRTCLSASSQQKADFTSMQLFMAFRTELIDSTYRLAGRLGRNSFSSESLQFRKVSKPAGLACSYLQLVPSLWTSDQIAPWGLLRCSSCSSNGKRSLSDYQLHCKMTARLYLSIILQSGV